MKRFDERFEHLDGAALRYCIEETHLDGVWPQKYRPVRLESIFSNEIYGVGRNKAIQARSANRLIPAYT